jgi:hypothetical protein
LIVSNARFVLLRGDQADAKEQGLLRQRFGEVVAVAVSGVRVLPGEISGVHREAAAVGGSTGECDRGQDSAVAVIEEAAGGKVLSPNAGGDVGQGDVVCGVVGDEFVDQRGRGCVGQVGHHIDAGAGKAILHCWKGVGVEGRRRADGGPGIVDEAVEAAELVVDHMVDAEELFAIGGELRWGRLVDR